MSIDQRFFAATQKVKRGATHGTHSDECAFRLRHFKCRDKTCVCDCHSKSVPRLQPRTESEDE